MAETVIAGGVRTALGAFGGSLSGVEMTDLAGQTGAAAIRRAGVRAEAVDHCVFTTTVPSDRDSLFAARVVGMKAGVPEEAGALHVVRACASGLQSILSADQQVRTGHSKIALAGGAESYSRAPFATTTIRWGAGRGTQQLEDMLDWAYRCPFSQEYMGETAENLAEDFQLTREAMDDYAAQSQARARAAIESGFLAEQIEPVEVTQKRQTITFDTDECPRADATLDKLASLRPAFRDGGKVTAGNASAISDGAAAMVLMRESTAQEKGAKPVARIVAHTNHAQEPEWFTTAPVASIQKLLEKAGWTADEVDLYEINEAFSVVPLAAMRELNLPAEKVNIQGGAIALGHPIGASGARILVTLINALQQTGGKKGVASLCIGGGEATSVAVELV